MAVLLPLFFVRGFPQHVAATPHGFEVVFAARQNGGTTLELSGRSARRLNCGKKSDGATPQLAASFILARCPCWPTVPLRFHSGWRGSAASAARECVGSRDRTTRRLCRLGPPRRHGKAAGKDLPCSGSVQYLWQNDHTPENCVIDPSLVVHLAMVPPSTRYQISANWGCTCLPVPENRIFIARLPACGKPVSCLP